MNPKLWAHDCGAIWAQTAWPGVWTLIQPAATQCDHRTPPRNTPIRAALTADELDPK